MCESTYIERDRIKLPWGIVRMVDWYGVLSCDDGECANWRWAGKHDSGSDACEASRLYIDY